MADFSQQPRRRRTNLNVHQRIHSRTGTISRLACIVPTPWSKGGPAAEGVTNVPWIISCTPLCVWSLCVRGKDPLMDFKRPRRSVRKIMAAMKGKARKIRQERVTVN